MAKNYFKIEGMAQLQKSIDRLGKVPQKYVTPAAKKGMNIVLRDSKASAPFDTGTLKKGIKLAGEKSRYKGKKVYEVVFDRAMNDVFQKKNAEGKITAYYPVSQEYGYFTKSGRYIPGFKFIHHSLAKNTQIVSNTMVSTLKKKIDAEIMKGGLK